MQIKIVMLMSAIRGLWYNMDKGLHSKLEMDLREDTELANALVGLGVPLAEQHKGTLSLSSFLPA